MVYWYVLLIKDNQSKIILNHKNKSGFIRFDLIV